MIGPDAPGVVGQGGVSRMSHAAVWVMVASSEVRTIELYIECHLLLCCHSKNSSQV